MINLSTGREYIPKEGDIIKRELTSRQSWTVDLVDGRLMAVPNTNSYCPDTEPIELDGDFILLADIRGIDFLEYYNNTEYGRDSQTSTTTGTDSGPFGEDAKK